VKNDTGLYLWQGLLIPTIRWHNLNQYTQAHFAQSALITIDTQNDFTLEDAPFRIPGTAEVVPEMVQMLDKYRSRGLTIIHVIRLYLQDGSNVDLCRRQLVEQGAQIAAPETAGADLVKELKPDSSVKLDADELMAGNFQQIGENEFVMYKPRWGAFYKTRLEVFLKDRGIDTLVFTGCNFPNCPRTSIYQASERDFRIVLVKDAMSQLYPKAEEEMKNIGANLLSTSDVDELVSLECA
jgi:nicotinamidase-related amidase